MNKEERLKEISRKMMYLGLIDAIPVLLVGFALQALFADGVEPIIKMFADESVAKSVLIVCVPVVVLCGFQAFRLTWEQKKLNSG